MSELMSELMSEPMSETKKRLQFEKFLEIGRYGQTTNSRPWSTQQSATA